MSNKEDLKKMAEAGENIETQALGNLLDQLNSLIENLMALTPNGLSPMTLAVLPLAGIAVYMLVRKLPGLIAFPIFMGSMVFLLFGFQGPSGPTQTTTTTVSMSDGQPNSDQRQLRKMAERLRDNLQDQMKGYPD